MKISPFKYISYASSLTFSVMAFGGFLYITNQNKPYQVHLPAHMEGDHIAGNPKGRNVVYVYLADDCSHCKKWEKSGKNEFDDYAKKNNLEVIYRKMKINSPIAGALDKNTIIFKKAGVINTPSFVFKDTYYRGAPSEHMMRYLEKKEKSTEKPASLKGKAS